MSGNSELGQYNYNANDYKLQNIAFNAKGQAIDTQRGFAEVTYNGFNSPLTLKLPGKEDLAFEYDLFKSKYSTSSAVSGKRKLYSSDGIVEITRKSGKGGGTLEVITYVTKDSTKQIISRKTSLPYQHLRKCSTIIIYIEIT
ncbi:hypothetical protein [Chryseobacterium wanjuense]